MKRLRKALIIQKGYGKKSRVCYYPIDDSEDINLELTTLHRIMNKIQVELLKPVEFCGMFGVKTYPVGVHSLDIDLAKLLVRMRSARFILPHKSVIAAKESRH